MARRRPWEIDCWDCGAIVDASAELDADGAVAQPVRCQGCRGGQAVTANEFDRIPTVPDGTELDAELLQHAEAGQ